MTPTALAVFVFDVVINNCDRRDDNPNCLMRGDELRIIDHELAFLTQGIIGWAAPWNAGALQPFATPGHHIFRAGLKGKSHSYASIRQTWLGLSDARVEEYEGSVPSQWRAAKAATDNAINLIRGVRNNIAGCLQEVDRVLR